LHLKKSEPADIGWKAWNAGAGDMNKPVDGEVAISLGTGKALRRAIGKVIPGTWRQAAFAAVGIGTLLGVSPALAQSATWQAAPTVTNPADGNFDFNANANWTPATAPGSATQTGTATFGATTANGANISFSAGSTTLGGFTFTAMASNYAFFNTNSLTFNGVGIVVNGGSATITNNGLGSATTFNNASTAGSATITNNDGATQFFNTSTAGKATIVNNGNLAGGTAQISFNDSSNAGNAHITNSNNDSVVSFSGTSTASSATFTNNSGKIAFGNASTAGSATIMNNGGGFLLFGSAGGTDTASAGSAGITNNSGSGTQFFANTTAGSAAITNNNGGGTSFGQSGGTDTSTAGSAIITNNSGGATQFFAGTSAGSATFTNSGVVNNGILTAGSISFFDNSTAGSATITNNNGGQTFFNNTSTAGSATFTNNGANSFTIFSDTSTAGHATFTNNGGVLGSGSTQFTAGSTAGSAAITNNGGGNTQFFANATAGNAVITNNGGGTSFNDASTAGSATITNSNGGSVQFGQSGGTDTASAGSATITNNGGGVVFFASSTAGSAAIANNSGGNTQFFANATAGSARITNSNGGFVNFGQFGGADTASAGNAVITNNAGSGTQFFAGTTAGSATFTNSGVVNNGILTAGFVSFFNNSTAGNATFTSNNGGQTFFSNASTASNAAITNNNGATFFFNASTAGSATITNNGGGTQFGGPGGAGTASAGNAVITNNGGFTEFFAHTTAANATITNNSGTVAFFDRSDGGSAHLINGAAGVIDFSGSTGPLGNNQLNVGSLAGSGTFIVGPQQRVNVSGSLAFTSGALYVVQVQGTSGSQIAVAGTATLAGTVEVDVTSRLTQKTTYTILTSSGLNNTTFGSATLEFANSFASNPVLSYVGNNVLLTLDPGLLSPILPATAPTNQVKVASAIDNGLLAGNNLSNAFSAIFNLSGNGLLNGLTQISGETATGAQQTTFNAMGLFMGLLTDPFMNRGGGLGGATSPLGYADEASAYAASKKTDAFAMFTKASPSRPSPASGGSGWEPRWSVWASGFGGSQSTSGNIALGSNNTTSNIAATAVGADYLLSPNTIAGFALAGGGTSFNVANGGTGRSDLFQAGAYLRHTSGAAYISAALAYGWQDITTNRTLMVGGLDQLRAEFNANAWSGRLEGGYRFVTPVYNGLGVTPYAAAQFVTFDLPQYAEQAIVGLNTFALSYGARDVTDPRSELGIRTDKSWAMSDGILTLRGRLAWAHDYDPDRSIAATFQTLPAASFVVNGAAQASESALTTASIEMKWKNGWSASATFEGEFSGVTNSYAGKGVVRYAW
jgi:uncharacterized protein with beta-barrel porin domain